ncbi:hypothetical protein K7432_018134, partial [Basidiobolus ranarum]
MRFVLALFIVLCSISSTITAPLPLKVAVNADTEPTGTPLNPGSCDDIKAKISVSDVNVVAVVCLKSGEE